VVDALERAPSEMVERAALLVSELVTNVVVHARTTSWVTVARRPRTVRVEVTDESDELPEMRRAPLGASRGRGLVLVECVARRWGVHRRRDRRGKTVWFELDHPAPSAA
jgi:anti-sigma regulatory factor (Ser/Thr protein kinase)